MAPILPSSQRFAKHVPRRTRPIFSVALEARYPVGRLDVSESSDGERVGKLDCGTGPE